MTLEELKLKYPIGTTFKVIKDYREAKSGDIVKLTKYPDSDTNFAYFSNDDYENVPLNLPHYSNPEIELYEESVSINEFKKGDYIVLLNTPTTDTSFPKNYIFKQREDYHYLLSELDMNGSKTNGWSLVNFIKKGYSINYNWRYATETEIAEYNRLGKPYDVTTLQTEKPVEKSLVGRYLKALVDYPNGTEYKKNSYIEIKKDDLKGNVYCIKRMKFGWGSYNWKKAEVELMPEGFTPDHVLKQSDKSQFEVGKWYKSNVGANYWYYIKVKSVEYENNTIIKVNGETINNISEFEENYYWNNENNIDQALKLGPLTDLSEIQSALPDDHPDKIKPIINMQEIQEEAKRRFPIGCKFKSTAGNTFVLGLDQDVYSIHGTDIYAHGGAGLLYSNNKWAKLLELPESELWVPKVGDWIYLIKSYRNLPIGTVAKINDSDVCPLSNPEESCFCISNYVGFACMPFKSHCRKAEPHEIPVNEPTEVTKSSMNKSQAIEYFKQFNIVEGTRYIASHNVRGKNPYISKADKRWDFVEIHTTVEKKAITDWLDCGNFYLWHKNNPHLAIIIPDYVEYNSKLYYVNNVIDFNTYGLKCNNGELINVSINNCNPLWQYNGKSFDEIIFRGIASELEDFKFFTPLVKYYKFDIDPFEEPVKQKVNKTNRLEMLPLKQMQIL